LKTYNDEDFCYSNKGFNPIVFINVILQSFDKGLDELAKIPDLEPKILSDLHKSSKLETYVKSPSKPRENPDD